MLEGLIPYSQRHFTRIDRLERSTFLLDYTLTGMSVIEPERSENETVSIDVDKKHHSRVEEEEETLKTAAQNEVEDHMELEDKPVRKRKSRKSLKEKEKTKVAYINTAAISSQA